MTKLYALIAIASAVVLLNACSKEEPAPAAAPVAAAPAPAAEPTPAKEEPGGYVPTEEERYHPSASEAADATPAPEAAAPETK